jgi:L-2-hydroxyglutarate oxidase
LSFTNSYNIAIIGGGILGTSIAYFLSNAIQNSKKKVILIEQEYDVARHTSSRNTGKVHAPFLYDPVKKPLSAKAAFIGFNMLKDYCKIKSLPFKQDGVLEVATYDKGIDILYKHLEWGHSNGLRESELRFLQKDEVFEMEPHVRCLAGLYCLKDSSVNYGAITKQLMEDAKQFGCKIVTGSKVSKITNTAGHIVIYTNNGAKFNTEYIVNTAGGNSLDIAHNTGVATDYTDLHFRGEYWQAPHKYHNLTKLSVYSVPKYPEYPFLDPHWIVRVDGIREVGPNAVPVFGPYAYSWSNNLRYFIPKIFESSMMRGTRRILIDKQFISLASNELKSSLSKTAMINRAREFLPEIEPSLFIRRGTAGIRSILIDRYGKFVPDTMIVKNDYSLHILNYNSPGATGALPIAAMVANQLIEDGIVTMTNYSSSYSCRSNKEGTVDGEVQGKGVPEINNNSIWDIKAISDRVTI